MSALLLAVHGGAGALDTEPRDPARERRCRAELAAALEAGYRRLRAGASALDAVVEAVAWLEDSAEFNAGRGSVLTSAGAVEMDASAMDGRTRAAGAVACVRSVRNPVRAARALLERGAWVLLAGEAADRFAGEAGLLLAEAEYFRTPPRQTAREAQGTVGAVARDAEGHLAAATSTGGIAGKPPGRVGDSPIPGAGTWADDATCAVSATGPGELLLRCVFAHEVDALVRHRGLALERACAEALARVGALGGHAGCIALSSSGEIAMPFTTGGMYRGAIGPDGTPRVALLGGEMLAAPPRTG